MNATKQKLYIPSVEIILSTGDNYDLAISEKYSKDGITAEQFEQLAQESLNLYRNDGTPGVTLRLQDGSIILLSNKLVDEMQIICSKEEKR